MNDEGAVMVDMLTGKIETIPPAKGQRYRCKLDTVQDVRREMAKVYRESRSGLIDTQDATKQVWMLQALQKVIVDCDCGEKTSESKLKTLDDLYNKPMTLAEFRAGQRTLSESGDQ